MPDHDEYGIPIKKQTSNVSVDEFGIPIRKKEKLPFLKSPDEKLQEVTNINIQPQTKETTATIDNQNDQFLNFGESVSQKVPKNAVKPIPDYNQPDIKQAIDNSVKDYFITNYNKNYKPTEREKEIQKENVIQEYKKGNLVPKKTSDGTTVMKRGTGFLESLNETLWTVHNRNLENKWLASLPKDEAIKVLNIEKNNPGLLFTKEGETAPSGIGGGIGEFLGENADLLAKGTAGAMAGASTPYTGAAGFGMFMSTLDDVAKAGYSQTLKNNYTRLKEQYPDMSDDEAYERANESALVGEAVSIGTNALLSYSIAPKLKPNVPVTGVIDGIKKSFIHSLEASPKVLGSAAAGSVVNDATSKAIGLDVSLDDVLKNASEATKEMAIMHFGLHALTEPTRIPSYIRPQIENVVASAPREGVREFYMEGEQKGTFPEGTTDMVMAKLSEFDKQKAIVNRLPITEEKKAAITGKLIQRKNLIEEREELSKYGASFNDQISRIEERINNTENEINLMHKAKDVFQFEKDALTGERIGSFKKFDELTGKEIEGVLNSEGIKEYGEADVKEIGEGENKTYKPTAIAIRKEGGLELRDKIQIEDEGKIYKSKESAQKAADKALAQHYYENKMDETLKPEQKSSVTVIRPYENKAPEIVENVKVEETKEPIQQTMEGSGTSDELISTKEGNVAEAKVPENVVTEERPEIVEIKQERKGKIKQLMKDNSTIEFIPSRELVKAKDPVSAKLKHDTIISKYKSLRKLIDCL